jgi:hypothetical protein
MIIWSGLGFLVAAVTFAICVAANLALDSRFGEGYYSAHLWAPGVSLILGGLISAAIGFALKKRNRRVLVDATTGERVALNASHSIFFVPMHIAGIIVSLIGFAVTAYDLVK